MPATTTTARAIDVYIGWKERAPVARQDRGRDIGRADAIAWGLKPRAALWKHDATQTELSQAHDYAEKSGGCIVVTVPATANKQAALDAIDAIADCPIV